MKKNILSRRELLYGLTGLGAGLVLPVLPSLLPRAHAAGTAAPKRVVFIMQRNGQHDVNFYPNANGTQQGNNIYSTPLSSLGDTMSPIFGSPWAPYKNKTSIVRGLDVITNRGGHCRTTFLCADGQTDDMGPPLSSASIDWIMEKSSSFYTKAPALRAIRFSRDPGRGFSFSRINGVAKGLPYINTDRGLFEQVFSNFTPPGDAPPVTNSSTAESRRKIALEKSMERLNLLSSNSRLSSTDRARLKDHLGLLSDIKNNITTRDPVSTPSACKVPQLAYYQDANQIRKIYENVNSTIAAAFSCDLTRIACYYIEDFTDFNPAYSSQHDWSHDRTENSLRQAGVAARWVGERVLDLAKKLDAIQDSDGTSMLDNTLIVWGNEQCAQVGNESHRAEDIPLLLTGGKNLGFVHGNFVDFRTRPFKHNANREDFPANGRPINQLHASIMRSVGVPRSEFEVFGEKNGKFGAFHWDGYDSGSYIQYEKSYTDKIPFIYNGPA